MRPWIFCKVFNFFAKTHFLILYAANRYQKIKCNKLRSGVTLDNLSLMHLDLFDICKLFDDLTDDIMDDAFDCVSGIFLECMNEEEVNMRLMEKYW